LRSLGEEILRSCTCWFEQARDIIQYFLFAAWENEERRSSGKGVFSGLRLPEGIPEEMYPIQPTCHVSLPFLYTRSEHIFFQCYIYKIV
jgi:hypothetical protein